MGYPCHSFSWRKHSLRWDGHLMGRRNRREDRGYEPLDLTQVVPKKPASPQGWESARQIAVRTAQWHESMDRRQRDARANQGIDWNVCLVPGCGSELLGFGRGCFDNPADRDHRQRLPLCLTHVAVAFTQAASQDDPLMIEAVASVLERRAAESRAREDAAKAARLADINGHIYFIRLNGLIKVGWSRSIAERINSYGPRVEVLVVYPGTRDDETNLHRQLKPARALGREWYDDGSILSDFIAVALEQHGPPPTFETWLAKPKQIVAGKRHR